MAVGMNTLKTGDKGKILALHCGLGLRKRLVELGVTPGSPFLVERVAPLGDPLDIRIRGYQLTIRREDATGIEVILE